MNLIIFNFYHLNYIIKYLYLSNMILKIILIVIVLLNTFTFDEVMENIYF